MVKKFLFAALVLFPALFSCATQPDSMPQAEPEPEPLQLVQSEPEPVPAPAVQEAFDPDNVPQEVYDSTLADIQKLVQDLNGIIRARNYNLWTKYLTEEYQKKINSKEFLDELVSKYPAFRGRVSNAQQYFTYVVVPSRANDHVDDIEFLSPDQVMAYTQVYNRVNAYTIDEKGQKAILYNLEKTGGEWKIAD